MTFPIIFSIARQKFVKEKKSAMNKDKIDIYELKSFIYSNFPNVITTSRKKEIVEKKMEVIISIFLNKKYFAKKMCRIVVDVFGINHATYFHYLNKFNDYKDLNKKNGIFQKELDGIEYTNKIFKKFISEKLNVKI